jgi:erythritol transport system permease protein
MTPSKTHMPAPWLLLLLRLRTFVALLLVLTFFSIAAPNFLSAANAVIVSKHVALNAFLAIGMTFVIITGGIDLSVGSIVGLCGMVAGWLLLHGLDFGLGWSVQFNTLEIALLVLAVGVGVGMINGWLITRLNVAPFIATLGTLYVARGAALLSSGGQTFPNLTGTAAYGSASFPVIGTGTALGIPMMIWLLIVVGVVAAYVSRRTPLGRHIYAVGGNERGAALSGVRVNRVKMAVYMFSGFCAALVGLIIASQLQASHPATGETFELNAIAAAVLGGTSM